MNAQLEQVLKSQQEQITSPLEHDKTKDEEIIQLVGFIVGEEEYAIPILNIQEIIKPIEYTRVPSTPDYVLGVFNLRGNVIPLIDLRKKFHLPPSDQTPDTRYIVMKEGDNIAGFVIDKLTEAIRLKTSQIDPAPETLHNDRGMISGIGKRDNSILTILKVNVLLKRDF
ncbi:MAG: chemotaxis protein CheW [Campylobacteraceae bacterium 4484_4]|nr:MAG: chemotaxis protein CheW [Campylobacteraceae bacterium 4484_4]